MIATSRRNFWIAQGVGWSLVGLSNLAVQSFLPLSPLVRFLNTLLPIVGGITVTTAYRHVIRQYRWSHWSGGRIILLLLGSSVINTVAFMLLIAVVLWLVLETPLGLAAWLSNFMVFFVMLLSWNVIYFLVHYLNRWHYAEVKKWQLASEVKDAQLSALRSQVNPHFVFNAINNIRSLILENPDRARDMLLHFSELFRHTLRYSEQDTVSLEQELDMVRQYLALAALQYEEKLRVRITVDECLYSYRIPLMLLQLLVENAIKHGISQRSGGGEIHIIVNRVNNLLYLNVRNTGSLSIPTTLEGKTGVGLSNIKKRLQLIYNRKANFLIRQEEGWVVASVQIPIA